MLAQDIINKYRRSFDLQIEGNKSKKVSVKVLPALAGVTVGMKLIKVILPSLGGISDGMNHDEYINGSANTFTNLAVLVCQQLDKVEVEKLILLLTEDLTVDEKTVDFDEYFAANYGELVEILAFSLKENFSSLFMRQGIKAQLMKMFQTLVAHTSQESEQQ